MGQLCEPHACWGLVLLRLAQKSRCESITSSLKQCSLGSMEHCCTKWLTMPLQQLLATAPKSLLHCVQGFWEGLQRAVHQ
jgi:hypothetical protein